ncbi:hypothetical protein Q0M94_25250 (plasmid) [Deinococcus radiomollis]|uniref:hypothetical protein n=1 Tax=Deinococcus radiomollis TaxID=468916 RepID=UPI0038924C51
MGYPDAENIAKRLIKQGAPFNPESRSAMGALGWAAPYIPDYQLTLGKFEEKHLQVIGERTDFHYLDANLALHVIHDTQPGAAAWLLSELDRAFGVTFPFATPKWAGDVIKSMARNSTPASRNQMYRKKHGVQVSIQKSERLIAKEGYFTTYSIELEFGKRLLPGRACDENRARTAFKTHWPRVLSILDTAKTLLIGTNLEMAYDVVIPAYLLETINDHKRDDQTFTGELADEMAQYFRNGVENFCVPLSSGRQTKRLYACLDAHAELAAEMADLLKGGLMYP